jgi:hypothetical protein
MANEEAEEDFNAKMLLAARQSCHGVTKSSFDRHNCSDQATL